jgi:uncharacterized protein YprB with RNaseH-like and TPR domain
MMGWTPAAAQVSENSSAPKRLPLSVTATIARRLRERVESTIESELFAPEAEQLYGLARISYREFQRAMRLKAELLREFQGKKLEECYPTQIVENEYGSCLKLLHRVPLGISLGDPHEIRQVLCSELKLLYGIGPAVEARLRALGYRTLADLFVHPRWGDQARRLLRELKEGDAKELQEVIHRWFPVSHPLGLKLFGLVPKEQLRLLDLESLGLFGRPVVLLGLAHPCDEGLEIHQYLARDILEELPALLEFTRELGEEPALVTYNGRAFDVNLLEERLGYYGLYVELEPVHLDLLPHARRRFRGRLPDVRLETVERHFGLERPIDLPSALVPDFYNTYLEVDNIGPLIPIIEHNKYDLIALGVLLVEFSRSP